MEAAAKPFATKLVCRESISANPFEQCVDPLLTVHVFQAFVRRKTPLEGSHLLVDQPVDFSQDVFFFAHDTSDDALVLVAGQCALSLQPCDAHHQLNLTLERIMQRSHY